MRNFVAIVDMDERNAFEGLHALERLDAQGAITLHETAVIERLPGGSVAPRSSSTRQPPLRRAGLGALIGAIAGLSAGPVGVMLGGAVGILGGALGDALRCGASDEYIQHVGEHLKPGTFAVIADVHENETGPIDASMAELGAQVLRDTRADSIEDRVDKRAETRRSTARPPSHA